MGEHRLPPWSEDEVVSAVRLGFVLGVLFACLTGTAVVIYPSPWSVAPTFAAMLVCALGWGVLRNGGPGGPSSRP